MIRASHSLFFLVTSALLLSLGCDPEPVGKPDPRSQRQTFAGVFQGLDMGNGTFGWLGIPYAQAPVGARRWRAPERQPPHAGVFKAHDYGHPCVQPASRLGGMPGRDGTIVGNEDCLTLNIHAQQPQPQQKGSSPNLRPVMVWIHGGGNRIGASRLYNGANLAAGFGVVVVTINYRLGVMGWLRHPGLRTGDPLEDSGNFGTLDLIAALRWVKAYIDGFGGDPKRVTIFGESAGARNVLSLMGSPIAKGLFHGAIAQSGDTRTTHLVGARTHQGKRPIVTGTYLAELLMASKGIKAKDPAGAARMLREADAHELVKLSGGPFYPQQQLFADGMVLPKADLVDCFADPNCRHSVPLMVGSTRDEMATFMAFNPYWVELFSGLPQGPHDPADYAQHVRLSSKYWKLRAADRVAQAMARSGGNVWMYRWDWDEEPIIFGVDLAKIFGAAHGFEIPFVFNNFEGKSMEKLFTRENRMGRLVLAREMGGYWTSFAALGSPRGQQPWMRWSPKNPAMLIFDTLTGGGLKIEGSNLTLNTLLEDLEKDPHYPSLASRCQELVQVFGAHADFTMARWKSFGCEGLDLLELATGERIRTP